MGAEDAELKKAKFQGHAGVPGNYLGSFVENQWTLQILDSVLSPWPVCLTLCQYHTGLNAVL